MTVDQKGSVVVITVSDLDRFGCPVCLVDHKTGLILISMGGATVVRCGGSGEDYLVLADYLDVSPLGFRDIPPGELSAGVHPKSEGSIGG